MKAQTLVDSLSELMVDASLGTIQCLEEIVSNSLPAQIISASACLLEDNNRAEFLRDIRVTNSDERTFFFFVDEL